MRNRCRRADVAGGGTQAHLRNNNKGRPWLNRGIPNPANQCDSRPGGSGLRPRLGNLRSVRTNALTCVVIGDALHSPRRPIYRASPPIHNSSLARRVSVGFYRSARVSDPAVRVTVGLRASIIPRLRVGLVWGFCARSQFVLRPHL